MNVFVEVVPGFLFPGILGPVNDVIPQAYIVFRPVHGTDGNGGGGGFRIHGRRVTRNGIVVAQGYAAEIRFGRVAEV